MSFIEYEWMQNENSLIGCDEVGRGPLAGPVVGAAAGFFGTKKDFEEVLSTLSEFNITDSKKITAKKRARILENLKLTALSSGVLISLEDLPIEVFICELSHEVIDEINILQASLKAMQTSAEAVAKMRKARVVFDGNKVPKELPSYLSGDSLVKGDSKSALIGLASIVAKEYRDLLMMKMGEKYPGYDFEKNAGYPTVKHREAISSLGVTPIHRRTFKGVREYIS